MKKGLVLEGGAMRGLFTCGVLDVFMEEGIDFDGGVGTSAGALFGCNFKSKQPKRAVRYTTKYSRDSRFGSFRSLLRTGDYYGKEFCYSTIPFELDKFDVKTYHENPMEFYVCATDIVRGRAVYHNAKKGDRYDIEWMRASASMPLFSNIVKIGGHKLLDGGITDSIPLKFLESKGYEKNVVILTQPTKYRRKPTGKVMYGLLNGIYWKYPRMLKAMEYRYADYNQCLEYIHKQEREGHVFVIAPEDYLNVSRIEKNPDELLRVYRTGRRVAKKHIDEIKEFLK